MIQAAKTKVMGAPTPMAGLALGIASLGWSWENAADLHGVGQWSGAAIASVLLLILAMKFLWHNHALREDLAHPVVGSVVPTFAMASMVVSHSVGQFFPMAGDSLWLLAVVLHVIFLVSFTYHRAKAFELHHMVPSWFVPPVGIIVADVSFSGNPALAPIAQGALLFGMVVYAVMLPMMIYRFMFTHEVPDAAKPTLAILAAPASLSLAGYLTVTAEPSPVIIALLFGIAVLMTAIIYLAFTQLLRLPFSPGYAAFTFPMVIGATALFKMTHWMEKVSVAPHYIEQVHLLAVGELMIATLVVGYVALRYLMFYLPARTVVSQA
ncbi:C4-dicarboxylate ABC transporter [Vibrio sp. V27_P1S3P104]|uniref:TDT family transporter n=1 Tax=Vibrio TaxID=662 RepID=UPI000C165493|nr:MULTISPECIES: TDT family transporter [Vibrio]NAW70539.1 C4-dicarboxylate ABC transporter [Vibrio sp. V28_P6S34P95]NAX05010.1 C4-dicarboxylate ABC transporter [Vibrio sp. V30_P3S12P165]NAX35038.1 C4-dicarboxylate ABC transporter [Vibrio sp. V29_P1S30P107]NAX36022.1 C4-dicarboxylate ABC transporter [Vibrio sp. V27_P1S3P104]NAX40808.1 C4-dicarboxylate ABC transporter [Vibrio sp. V26_P1S5P106]